MPYKYEDETGKTLSYTEEVRKYIIESRHRWVNPDSPVFALYAPEGNPA